MKLTKLGQQGFTMIELIMVIVILAILSVVAIPKFMDMRTEAAHSAANGVFAAAQSAAVINHAAVLMGKTGAQLPAGALITDGATLMAALENPPEGWTISGNTITKSPYIITVTTAQTTTTKAVLTKSGTDPLW